MSKPTDLVLPFAAIIDGDLTVRHPKILERFERDRHSTVVRLALVASTPNVSSGARKEMCQAYGASS